jgi:hypothetical protein
MAGCAAKEDEFWKSVHQQDEKEDARWGNIMDSVDLMFTRMANVERTQHRMQVNQDAATAALQQVLKDQATLSKQIQTTGQAVAKLQMEKKWEDDSDTSSMDPIPQTPHTRPRQYNPHTSGETFHNPFHRGNRPTHISINQSNRPHLPKMTFPVFAGKDPKVWHDKCDDYFWIFDIPEFL